MSYVTNMCKKPCKYLKWLVVDLDHDAGIKIDVKKNVKKIIPLLTTGLI